MCNEMNASINNTNLSTTANFDEDTEIEDNNLIEEEEQQQQKSETNKRDIYKKKDQPYRKQFCTFDGCNAYFYVKWHLDRHLRKHNNETPFICPHDNCEKAFTCRSYLNKHIKQVHETEKKPQRVRKTYPCSECGHVFKQKYNLKVHMYQHTGECPFKCTQCDRSFRELSKLRKHIKTHAGYKCGRLNCDFIAYKWTELQKHVAQQHKETFKCTICDKKFNERHALTTHQKIHSGERLACSYDKCTKSYTTRSNLQAHIKMAHQNRKFICDHCSKEFKHKCTLTKHINSVHTTTTTEEQLEQEVTTRQPPIYIHRVSYAEKLTGIQCCEAEFKKILIDDKNYRKTIASN